MKIKNLKVNETYFFTINGFLQRYYGFKKNMFQNLTHSDLDVLLPDIKKTTQEEITEENVKKGKIILVKDVKHKIIAYDNPLLLEENNYLLQTDNSNIEVIFLDDTIDDYSDIEEEDLPFMSDIQLEQALTYFKLQNNHKMIRLIITEFRFRPKKGCKRRKIEKQIKEEKMEVD